MLRKCVAVLLIGSMSFAWVRPALAQIPHPAAPAAPTPQKSDRAPLDPFGVGGCIERGLSDGKHAPTGGAFAIGFVSGFFLGLIGTGIAYAGQAEPEAPAFIKYGSGDATCRMAYADVFGKMGKKQKRNAALQGGILGTVAIVVLVVSAGSSN